MISGPSTRSSGQLRKHFPTTPIVALTATADRLTQARHPSRSSTCSDPKVFLSSFDRPNINLIVRPGQRPRRLGILDFIARHPHRSRHRVLPLAQAPAKRISGKLIGQAASRPRTTTPA